MRRFSLLSFMLAGLSWASWCSDPSSFWQAGPLLLSPNPEGGFDGTAVKDPSIVRYREQWHLFYTARGENRYSLGYVAADRLEDLATAHRYPLTGLSGAKMAYAAAPQVFYFSPQKKWYLIYQTLDSNYQPVYAVNARVDRPDDWEGPHPLVRKEDSAKWIDFWVICDDTMAYLFYTRDHRDVYVMTTLLEDFPEGFGDARPVFGPVHEAVHVYAVDGKKEYHLLYEIQSPGDLRHFGLASASHPLGPWSVVNESYASGRQLRYAPGVAVWTEEVSHGEFLRSGYDQRMEYNPASPRLLVQGLLVQEHRGPYPLLPWRLGLLERLPLESSP